MKYSTVILLALGLSTNLFLHKVDARLKTEPIRNGQTGKFKYVVAIHTDADKICGGGILADNMILTAAHCVIDGKGKFETDRFYVTAGVNEIPDKKNVGIHAEVEKIYVPAEYKPPNIHAPDYPTGDIAVLKLKTGLGLGKRTDLSKLALPPSGSPAPTYLEKKAIVAGFGYDHVEVQGNEDNSVNVQKGYSDDKTVLRWGKTEIIETKQCERLYAQRMSIKHLCGKIIPRETDKPEGICSGDSGSPLVRNGETVIGVVASSHRECNDNKGPALYTKVTSFLDFIGDAMKDVKRHNMRVAISVQKRILGVSVPFYSMKEILS